MGQTARVARLVAAATLAAAATPLLAAPAYAESSSITASTGGYFYAEGIRKPDQSPAAPPNITAAELDRVGPGNLPVAAQAGREDKVSFLLFDLLDILPGSTVTKATLTLPLVPDDANNSSYAAAPAKVRACMSGPEGFNGDDGTSIQDAPARKCAAFSAPAKASADGKAYVFDLTKLAAGWVDGDNDGVALTAAEGAMTTPFQVVFGPAAKAVLDLEYTPAAPVSQPPPLTTGPDLGVGSGGTGSSGDLGGFLPPPADTGSAPPLDVQPVTPPAPAPAPGVAPAPQTAVAPVAAAGPRSLESLRPSAQFWLVGLLLAGLLVLLSRILGDATTAAVTSRPSRLTRALDERRRGLRGGSLSLST